MIDVFFSIKNIFSSKLANLFLSLSVIRFLLFPFIFFPKQKRHFSTQTLRVYALGNCTVKFLMFSMKKPAKNGKPAKIKGEKSEAPPPNDVTVHRRVVNFLLNPFFVCLHTLDSPRRLFQSFVNE